MKKKLVLRKEVKQLIDRIYFLSFMSFIAIFMFLIITY